MKIFKRILIVVSATTFFSPWVLSSSNAFECNIPIFLQDEKIIVFAHALKSASN